MENDPDNPIPPRLALYHGVVTARNDPLKIGRVRVSVPGLVDESDWAFPLSLARGRGRGFFDVPEVGAEVGVWWLAGDTDRAFYVPGHFVAPGGEGQGPTAVQAGDVSADDAPDIHVWETGEHVVLLDGRSGVAAFEVRDKSTGDGFRYERGSMTLELSATTKVRVVAGDQTLELDASGSVSLSASLTAAITAALKVELGGSGLSPMDGVVTGQAIDMFSGSTQFALGNASALVLAKKLPG